MYPQAVYFPIRTLYLTLKIEQRERYKSGMSWLGKLVGSQGVSLEYPRALLLQAHTCPQLPSSVWPVFSLVRARGLSLMAK